MGGRIELDRRPRLEHAGEVALGAEVNGDRAAQSASRSHGNNRTVSFEGTPVADARNVYVAVTDRREQTATYVACFDADTGAEPLDPLPGIGVARTATTSSAWAWGCSSAG